MFEGLGSASLQGEHGLEGFRERERAPEKMTLEKVAALAFEEGFLELGLDTFAHDLEPELMREGDRR